MGRFVSRRAVQELAGGFKAWLTVDDVNAWHKYIITVPIWSEVVKLACEIEAITLVMQGGADPVCREQLTEYVDQKLKLDKLEEQLFTIAEEWYTKHVKEQVDLEAEAALFGMTIEELRADQAALTPDIVKASADAAADAIADSRR